MYRRHAMDGRPFSMNIESISPGNINTVSKVSTENANMGNAEDGNTITIRYSHYWPPLGGVNCSRFVNGQCLSRMASGERWQDWIGRAAACPIEWPFWTRVLLDGQEWICLDRGGKIVYGSDDIPFVDFLTGKAAYSHSALVQVQVVIP